MHWFRCGRERHECRKPFRTFQVQSWMDYFACAESRSSSNAGTAGIETRARHQQRQRKKALELPAMCERDFRRTGKDSVLDPMRNVCAALSIVRQQQTAWVDWTGALDFRFSERTLNPFDRILLPYAGDCSRLCSTRRPATRKGSSSAVAATIAGGFAGGPQGRENHVDLRQTRVCMVSTECGA